MDKPFSPDIKEYTGKVKGVDTSVRTNQYGGNRVETRDPYAVIDIYFNDDLIFEIDKNPPVIENKNDVINIDYDTITLDLSSISSSSGIHKVILPNGEEIINPKEDKITYKVKYNDTYTFKIIDKAGNSTDANIEASNLKDKYELPDTSGLMSYVLSISIISLLYGAVITFKNNKK